MKINYDKVADAVYIRFKRKKLHETVKLSDRILADVDKDGNTIGLEILDASSQMSKEQMTKQAKEGGVPVEIQEMIA